MSDTSAFRHPDRIGPYHVLQVLGEGGMGVVYEAEQKAPVVRRVAVKMMKVGMDTREVVGRFEAERQALAVMDHSGIATVFDAGATDEGRPYFVMELVHGVPIDAYCDRQCLTMRRRVELFRQVCDAVQHAHQKGVIHRDLKPGNVLVTEDAGRPQPKIIDFGVAKATGRRLTDDTFVTTFGQAIGTLAYMSPEQAEMSGLDVDTRSDVYSLGVILYELLLGVVPVDPTEVGGPSFLADLVQRDTTPPTPSRRLTGLSRDRRGTLARLRRTSVESFRKELRRDLQWIVLKAMEKDRARRYETAHELAADLRRYLAHEPVLAHPPSARYRLGKLVRRNRTVVAMAAVLAALTVAYGISMVAQARRVARERDRAALEANTARRVSDFMAELFAVSDPSEARGRSVTALEILERGRERIENDLAGEPVLQGRLMTVMGRVYFGLGLYEEAEELLVRGLDAVEEAAGTAVADSTTAGTLTQLAWLYRSQQRWDEALPLAERAARIAEETWGAESREYAGMQQTIGMIERDRGNLEAARAALETSLRLRRAALGPEHEEVGWSLYHLGWLTYREGRLHEALSVYEEALPILESALPPDDPRLAWSYNDMAIVFQALGEPEQARAMHERVLELRERTQGPRHPDVAASLDGLANVLQELGDLDRALEHRERALGIRREAFGHERPTVASSLNNIGLTLQAMTRYAEARERYQAAIGIYEAVGGPDDPRLNQPLNNLGYLLRYVGRMDLARPYLRRALAMTEKASGPDHIALASTLINLGFLERDSGRHREAVSYMERAFGIAERTYGENHARLVPFCLYLGGVLSTAGEGVRALEVLTRGWTILEAEADPDVALRTRLDWELGLVYRSLGDTARAFAHFERTLETSREGDGEESAAYADWQMRYWTHRNDLERAVDWLRRLVDRGYRDPWILRNHELEPLRRHPRFDSLTGEIRRVAAIGRNSEG